MTTQTFERSALDGKDREQLVAIASALGVKSLSRMKKAELVEAIVGAGGAGRSNGKTKVPEKGQHEKGQPEKSQPEATKRTIRSAKATELDPISKIAAEEDAIASGASNRESEAALPIARRRTPVSSAADAEVAAADAGPTTPERPQQKSNGSSQGQSGQGQSSQGQSSQGQSGQGQQSQQWRDNDGGGRNNRRRRRGRNRGDRNEFEPREAESTQQYTGEMIEIAGLVDLRDEGYGFLRTTGYLPGRNDAYVSASLVRRHALRKGDYIRGAIRPPASSEKYPAMGRIDEVNGMTSDDARNRVRFEDLTPLFPDVQLKLEQADQPLELTGRIVDLISPIGKGQRGMIVSPPKAGKTTIIKQIVGSIERNNPECHVMVLQVDERPEEVTDMKRHVLRAEVISSTFDRPSDEHCHVAELAIERAKRLVEMGKDVVVILDGITRLARAYNLAAPASGRIMSGGIDAGALYPPKKFFGAARNVEEGGSLTIIATALVETNSKMDEHIFEEFKGTGNMELRLNRHLSERRIFPAIDVDGSSTRHEELLFDRQQLNQVWKLRRVLHALEGDNEKSGKGLELLIDKLRTTRSNDEFLSEIAKAPTIA
jgi:transcription termination factor Rho